MGYRSYIGSIPRKEYNEIKNMSIRDLFKHKKVDFDDQDECISVYDIPKEVLFEMGKYFDAMPKKLLKPFFINKETQKLYTQENDFYLVGKKFLEHLLELNSNKVKKIYSEMLSGILTEDRFPKIKQLSDIDEKVIYKILDHVKSMGSEWGCSEFSDSPPYNLKDGNEITTSWKYEYNVFELVRLYKTFDWKNNVMIFYAW